jgi:PadR family transcriptional regulator, regulatory protein PadR
MRAPTLLLTPTGPRPILLSTSRVRRVPITPRAARSDALRGSVDLLILKALSLGATHGWGIGLRIQELSRGRLDANQGSLYPALQRLEHRGDIASEWRSTENNRRARYYTITRQGRRALGQEVDRWHRFAAAIGLVLEGRS